MPGFYPGAGNLNPGLHMSMKSTLATYPSPQLWIIFKIEFVTQREGGEKVIESFLNHDPELLALS